MEKYDTAGQSAYDNTTQRMRFACWKTNATHTHTHTEYVIFIYFTAKMVSRTRLNLTLHLKSLLCYFINMSQKTVTIQHRAT